MSDECSPLPWSAQQWARLRSVAQEAANKARVASAFLSKTGPLPPSQTTVPSQWMYEEEIVNPGPGDAELRLEVDPGRTLHLTTISSNIYLRGSEVHDPSLSVVEAKIRRTAEILGRVEDAIVFNGVGDENGSSPKPGGEDIVKPKVYTVTGGRGLTGLLQAPGTLWNYGLRELRSKLKSAKEKLAQAAIDNNDSEITTAKGELQTANKELTDKWKKCADAMCVPIGSGNAAIVDAFIQAIEKLETRGQFGPFAAVLGDKLFADAYSPNSSSLVLPSDRIIPFLGTGGSLWRSSTIPPDQGLVIALASDPVELVVGTDLEVRYLQTTEEPRYVIRVFERFVLRIKQLEAICAITSGTCEEVLKTARDGISQGSRKNVEQPSKAP